MRPCSIRAPQSSFGEHEVGGVVAVQVADLARPTLNANSPRRPGPAATPGQEVTVLDDLLARSLFVSS